MSREDTSSRDAKERGNPRGKSPWEAPHLIVIEPGSERHEMAAERLGKTVSGR